eukprot:gnl/MRDRNA2_/MRDRNA2_109993_c0_seq1.p1 gnl/MRDRNA2_/MRDRNA2_109993_c0~~gnl/MRDRNA2_/MRDRNA2_109993_c0_seq1.p1  ORF type:complete len:469 (+),score=116.91 gnl/MRDRNA2_/MRDRNA2_109993_c0_seq1:45-1409(+)
MAAKGTASPKIGGIAGSHDGGLNGPGPDVLRVADLLRHGTDPAPNSGGLNSPALTKRYDGSKSIGFPSRENAGFIQPLPAVPTWSEASVQSIVQARIDVLAERISVALAGLQSQADNERRNVEHHVERMEGRVESRVAGLEARLAVAAEQVTRSELKERDLASRVAAMQEEAQKAAELRESIRAREAESERRVRETECRLSDSEELCRRAVARLQKVERAAEERDRKVSRIEESLREAVGQPRGHGEDFVPRMEALEAQMASLRGSQLVTDPLASSGKDAQWAAALEGDVQRAQMDLQELALRLEEQSNDLRARLEDQAQERTDSCVQVTSAIGAHRELTARLDDFDVRLGSVKIKVDSYENRLRATGERIDSVCAPLQEGLRQRLDKHREEIVREVECALEVMNQRIDQTRELIEEAQDHPTPLATLGSMGIKNFRGDNGNGGSGYRGGDSDI